MQRTFDVQAVREQFPALGRTHNGRGVVYFDGPGGSQVARQAIEAITGYMERGGANLHGVFPTSTETEQILADTRKAAADFLGAAPDEVAFGANMTTLTFAVARALAGGWDRDSEIVVTELDHRANVDPWLIAAAEQGARVRPGVKLYVAPDGVRKTPTIAFTVQGQPTDEVCARMLEHGFFIAAGDFYASTLTEKLGIGDSGGFIRAGLAPYNTEEEVERFFEALERIVRET